MTLFDMFNSIYYKNGQSPDDLSRSECIAISRWVSRDVNNIDNIKKILPFLFYINPQYYYYLLYFFIRRGKPPYLKKINRVKIKEDKLLDKVQLVLGWSKRELEFNRGILEKTILVDKKKWKKELAL